MPGLDYRIDATRPGTRELSVTLEFDPAECANEHAAEGNEPKTPPDEVVLFLPTWTPGSYLIREYSRHLGRVEAEDAERGQPLACAKVSKNRFRVVVAGARRVRVRYRVHAHELSVRTADVTSEHAYWNHACVLLWPVGRPGLRASLTIDLPRGWDLACALPAAAPAASGTHRLVANGMDEAFDSPCLAGRLSRHTWRVDGVEHEAVFDGLDGVVPPASLAADLEAVVRTTAAVFGGRLPYERYSFLCLCTGDGHGGLEHASSTTLLVARTALQQEKSYREFLSLAAHELFHAWNVKRMRPVEFWTYDYENENYTSLLWLIEGWTAYYDDLVCMRAGGTSRADYLAAAAKNVNAMLGAPGRRKLSLQESSFDAWIRLYRPDANTRNSSQNYYGNGAVAAMCLDLRLRSESGGARSLDDVVRELYATTFSRGRGYTVEDVFAVVGRIGGETAVRALRDLVSKELEPDLAAALAPFGIRVVVRDADRPYLGVSFDNGATTLASVIAGSPAFEAGLAPGDEVLALQNLRVDAGRWQDVLQATARIGEPLEILISRRGVIRRCTAVPQRGPGTVQLEIDDTASAVQVAQRDGWLPPPAPKTTAVPTVIKA